MGLDVWAYTKLVKIENRRDEDEYEGIRFHENPHFLGRGEGVDFGAEYEDSDADHCGSGYIVYTHWREAVARAAGYPAVANDDLRHAPHLTGAWEATEGPLWELLCFSDCEGTIGPVVSAKLAADFETHAHLRDTLDERHHKWWDFFARAFKATADGGAMRFS